MKTLTTAVAVVMFLAIGRATAGQQSEPQAPVAPRFLSQTGLYSDAGKLKIDSRNRLFSRSRLLSQMQCALAEQDQPR